MNPCRGPLRNRGSRQGRLAEDPEQVGDDAEPGLHAIEQLLGGARCGHRIQWGDAIHGVSLSATGVLASHGDLMGRRRAHTADGVKPSIYIELAQQTPGGLRY